MEMNITKQSISSYETIFEQTIEQAIDTDFTMPDYFPSMVRILNCKMVPEIASKNVINDTLSIDGSVLITVIYTDDEKKIRSYDQLIDFQKSIPVGELGDNPQIHISIAQDYANCRAITEKKIDVHGVLSIKIKIMSKRDREILTDIDCDGIQIKRGSYPATNPLGCTEKIVIIEEDLELSRNSGPIKSVLRNEAQAKVDQCKLIGNKAVVKGELIINALYCTDEGKVEKYENRIPFNQIVDINLEGENCECDAEIIIMSSMLKPRTNLSGEAKSFAFESKLAVLVMSSCENDISIIYDTFCTKRKIKAEHCRVRFNKLSSKTNERFMCKKTLDFSENTFGSIVDMWCENKVNQTRISDRKLYLNGTTIINILVYDKDNQPQYFEKNVDFEYSNDINDTLSSAMVESEVTTSSCAFTVIDETKLEVMVELCIACRIYVNQEVEVVADIDVSDAEEVCVKKSPIVMYYANSGERVWDIAKYYNSDCLDIININKIDGDVLNRSRVLLIP